MSPFFYKDNNMAFLIVSTQFGDNSHVIMLLEKVTNFPSDLINFL